MYHKPMTKAEAHADGARDRVECLWLSERCPAQGLFETANVQVEGAAGGLPPEAPARTEG